MASVILLWSPKHRETQAVTKAGTLACVVDLPDVPVVGEELHMHMNVPNSSLSDEEVEQVKFEFVTFKVVGKQYNLWEVGEPFRLEITLKLIKAEIRKPKKKDEFYVAKLLMEEHGWVDEMKTLS